MSRLSRPAYALAVTAGAAAASFGFLAAVVLGLIVGGSAAGPVGAIVVAAGAGIGWVVLARRAWQRLQQRSPS